MNFPQPSQSSWEKASAEAKSRASSKNRKAIANPPGQNAFAGLSVSCAEGLVEALERSRLSPEKAGGWNGSLAV